MSVRFGSRARALGILVSVVLLLLPVSAAFAGGNGATTFTQTFHNATDSFPTLIPCLNAPGTVTITYNGVMHFTVNKAGDFWATGTQTGTAVAVPDNPSLPTYTGHFTAWFGTSDNMFNSVDHSTFTVHATAPDGSSITFHETMHFSTNANGVVTASFDKPVCG